MLSQLTITNFAIIKHLEIDFQSGLNILSGETGAGKSIIINAVNLILGGRATADTIRTGFDEARVEALFSLPGNSYMKEILSNNGIPFDGELLIRRIISRANRNRIIINSSIATLQLLSRIGQHMISISGQHEHQILLKPDNHLFLLDDFGNLNKERLDLTELFISYELLKKQGHRLETEIREGREKKELIGFQIQEIDEAHITAKEDEYLEEEKNRLRYSGQLRTLIGGVYENLYDKEDSILGGISQYAKELARGSDMDIRLKQVYEVFESVKVELEEAAFKLRDLQDSITDDPQRLEEVEERLQLLNRLKRKYRPSLSEILELKDELSAMKQNLYQKKEELEKINNQIREKEGKLVLMGTALSKSRKKAADELEAALEAELDLLDMGGTRFKVRFNETKNKASDNEKNLIKEIRPEGFDIVEFMISPNIGETLRPLTKIASGGELSRIMLALKTILARKSSIETIIFDEVDAGIGGATAEVVGEKLRFLSDYHQILCITHLPQIASKGETHYLVKKIVDNSRTQTQITRLNLEERIDEIARLLGGKVITDQAKAHAREMLNYSFNLTRKPISKSCPDNTSESE